MTSKRSSLMFNLLEFILQDDGHFVGIFRLEAERQFHTFGVGAEGDIDRPLSGPRQRLAILERAGGVLHGSANAGDHEMRSPG